jgi:putative flavoprotein involved in K+ transport
MDMDVVIVGAGQAGLALGYYLAQQGLRFVILDGAQAVGDSWRKRYDSLRLFTPAQYNNLPGLAFPAEPDSYPTKDDVADYLALYARTFHLPVRVGTRVTHIAPAPGGYAVHTDSETFVTRQVAVATGPFQKPFVPSMSQGLASEVYQVHSAQYQNPQQLPSGPVLVVGAGNSGAQIARGLSADRQVYLSSAQKLPYVPQRILGKDMFWWGHALGLMQVPITTWLGRKLSQRDPLIGTDLRQLVQEHGVELVGRTVSASGHALTTGDGRTVTVNAVVWATGFRPDYEWLKAEVFDERGIPVHKRGVARAPGIYFIGLPWLHTRGSGLLGGVGRDAEYLSQAVMRYHHAA